MATPSKRAKNRPCSRCIARGVATVEAVVALPVLVLLFVAIFFFRDLSGARHEAAARVRSCAWLYSAGNCTAVPAGCEGVLTDVSAVGDAAMSIPMPALSESGASNRQVNGIVDGLLDKALLSLFGSGANAHATKDFPRPPLLGGGIMRASSNYHLACNLAPTTPAQVVRDAWDIWSPL
jgi:hypothetical protein